MINGVINEYDADGTFVRTILAPARGRDPRRRAHLDRARRWVSAVAPDGTIYYADIGIVIDGTSIGPGDGTGTVRRIRFVDGEPQAPETMAEASPSPTASASSSLGDSAPTWRR